MSPNPNFLTEDDLKLLEQHGDVKQYAPQDVILQQDTHSDRIFYIRAGMVQVDFSRVYNTDVLAYIKEGEFVGEVAFLDHQDSSASVSAVKDVQMLELTRDTMDQLLESDPGLAGRFFKTVATTLARRIRASNAQ